MPPRALKSALRPETNRRLEILETFRAPRLSLKSKAKDAENQEITKGVGSLENQALWLSLLQAGHLNQLAATSYDKAILHVFCP